MGGANDGETDIYTTDNLIVGNKIGTDITGELPIPNQSGVQLRSGAERNQIGSEDSPNIIRFNQWSGIAVTLPYARYNRITSNSISDHAEGPGISFWPETEPRLPIPVIAEVMGNTVKGTCDAPDSSVIEVYNDPEDEGRTYLGSTILQDSQFLFSSIDLPSSRSHYSYRHSTGWEHLGILISGNESVYHAYSHSYS